MSGKNGEVSPDINWTKIIVALITASITLVGTLGTVYLRHHLQQETEDPITRSLMSSQALNKELKTVLQDSGAERVTIAQFHNGTELSGGQRYEKISTTHQVVAPGIGRSKERISEFPITLFEDVLLEVENNSVVKYDSAEEVPNVGSIFEKEGVSSLYIFKLESVDKRFIGIMFLEYTSSDVNLSDKELQTIREEARAVGSYLSSNNQ